MWLTASEVAQLLRLSPASAKNWLEGGHFPCATSKGADGQPRFLESDVLEVQRRMVEVHEKNRTRELTPTDFGDEEIETPLL